MPSAKKDVDGRDKQARALGNGIGGSEDLVGLLVQEQMIVAEVRPLITDACNPSDACSAYALGNPCQGLELLCRGQ
jgi:hypothetical protein